MATLTKDYQKIGEKWIANTGWGDLYARIYAKYNSYNSSAGTVNITTLFQLYLSNGNAWAGGNSISLDGAYWSGDININGGEGNVQNLLTSTYDVSTNADGSSKGYTTTASYTIYGVSDSLSVSFNTPTVPRYASISSFSVSKRDETSVTFNWKTNATVDYVWYSTNNGSSWTGYNTPDGTSGSFTVSGLSANTTYNFKIRVRRKDSQLNTTSSRVQQTTYNWPYVSAISTNNLTIGNSQTLTLYNPLSRNVSVYMKKDNASGTQFYSGNTTGTSITFTPGSADMYASIPSATSGNCVYYCTYSSHTVSTKSGTYSINAADCKPTFEDFAYSTDMSSLTGDNDTIITGKTTSTIIISSANKAIGVNSATIVKYRLECGSVNPVELEEDEGTLTGTLANCDDRVLKVTAVDSRGLETSVSKTVTNYKVYFNPIYNNAIALRKNGVDSETRLNLEINLWKESFGSVNNSITELKYRTKTTDSGASWSNWFTINISELSYDGSIATLEDYLVHLNGSSGGFTIGIPFYLQVSASDELETTLSELVYITDGKVGVSLQQDSNGNYHAGINEMPDKNYGVNTDSINLKDGIYLNGTLLFWEE